MTQDTITDVLTERGKRYGAFKDQANISQTLKDVLRKHINGRKINIEGDQKEALEMICHKLARIANGDPDYADSWVDIAGYAQLVADRLQGTVR